MMIKRIIVRILFNNSERELIARALTDRGTLLGSLKNETGREMSVVCSNLNYIFQYTRLSNDAFESVVSRYTPAIEHVIDTELRFVKDRAPLVAKLTSIFIRYFETAYDAGRMKQFNLTSHSLHSLLNHYTK